MLSRILVSVLVVLAISPGYAALPAAVDGEELPSLAPMLEGVQPAIVNISTTTVIQDQEHPLMQDPFFRRFFNIPQQQRPTSSLGQGLSSTPKRAMSLPTTTL